jgi:diamine N-acetyltransferase
MSTSSLLESARPAGLPPIWLEGERVALGAFVSAHAELYWRWEQEPDVIVGLGRQTPESREVRLAGYQAQAQNMDTIPRFTVYDLADAQPRPVGHTTLRIDHHVRVAEYVIVLGKEGRGRGLGVEATALTLDYAFRVTALRTVKLQVLEHHIAAITTYQRAGFIQTGRLPDCGYWYGKPCDEIIMCAHPHTTEPVALIPVGGTRD